MKVRIRHFVVVVAGIIAIALGGCAGIPKEDQGMVIGGVLGGLGGSMLGSGNGSILGTIGGTFAGGYLGRMVGRSMDEQDKMLHEGAVEKSLSRGSNESWENPRTGHKGRVEAGRVSRTRSGYCREYTEYVTIDGREVPAHGTACQERDGSWRIRN
ncbi:MAG: hypothetical protein A2942_01455 [Candidatus Lloydbacteria bacterium RIFCSPLOWO2_01_FULL_50_20]|uniref:Surface antigen domain-containing protein n=1 Tax=Candidatus Lloydbacteria bacterium RIFCSPLOWO2_01_FULL_50_20 TaxID=1798665 RepID=A0A1G2DHX0_9BACT|nr:MAG: hypothetical protein A2942_01455 [Candidatus Lloydbacteria bacterium RIFCSPLOWO2_01_FULL_50_20]